MLIIVPNYLTTVKQYLEIFFFKNYVLLERSPLDEAKTSIKPLKKFLTYSHEYIINLLWKSKLTAPLFLSKQNLQNLGLKGGNYI